MLARVASIETDRADFLDWTFMSVHHWGEESAGEWTLRIVDSLADDVGTLESASLTLFGSDTARPNTPPEFVNTETYAKVGDAFYHRLYAKGSEDDFSVGQLPLGLNFDQARHNHRDPDREPESSTPISSSNAFWHNELEPEYRSLRPSSRSAARRSSRLRRGWSWPSVSDWSGQTATSRDGVDAIASVEIAPDSFAALSLTVVGPGTMSFYYKVSSEEGFDLFGFLVGLEPSAPAATSTGPSTKSRFPSEHTPPGSTSRTRM